MNRFPFFPIWAFFLFLLAVFFHHVFIGACEDKIDLLRHKYERVIKDLDSTSLDVPITVKAHEGGSHSQCNVYGIVHNRFAELRDALTKGKNWCDILLLHPNVKACTFARINDKDILTFYSGRKFYQAPEAAFPLSLDFHIEEITAEYFDIRLFGGKGPLSTRNCEIRIRAFPLGDKKTFLHLSYAYDYGISFQIALKSYLATIGSRKVGFTIIGRGEKGEPIYVRGAQGMIERNAARYYFSIHAYLETLIFPEDIRFQKRISRFYDMVNQYPKQLYEQSKGEYEANKTREYENQLDLQEKIQKQRGP